MAGVCASWDVNKIEITHLRMQKVFIQPCLENTDSTLGEPSLRSPNRLLDMFYKPWPLTVRGSITVVKPWGFILSIAYLIIRLTDKLKLVSNHILQASKMFGHGIYSQTCIRSCVTETSNIFKWSYYCVNLLIVVFVPPANLFMIDKEELSHKLI